MHNGGLITHKIQYDGNSTAAQNKAQQHRHSSILAMLIAISLIIISEQKQHQVMAATCPPKSYTSSCTCCGSSPDTFAVYLDCSYQQVNDTRMSDILDSFLLDPRVSPLRQFKANNIDDLLTECPVV